MIKETRQMTSAALLLAAAVAMQLLGRSVPQISQVFVGPAVNAILIMTVWVSGWKWAVMIGVLTPVLAFLTGVLAAPMGPFIPFIAAGNIIYVTLFSFMAGREHGKVAGVLGASLFKMMFLYFSASKLISLFALGIPQPVKEKLVLTMGLPQLFTALAGGALALVLLRLLERRTLAL